MPTSRRRRTGLGLFGVLAFLGSLLGAPHPAGATILPVTNCGDTAPFPPGLGGQLRTLVLAAAPGDTVVIPACTITLSGALGPIQVFGSMTIQGAGAGQTILQAGGGAFPVFFLPTAGTAVTISGMTLQNSNGGVVALTGTTLTVTDSTVTGHSAPAIVGSGSTAVTVTDSTVSSSAVGGIVVTAGTLAVTRTTVSGNSLGAGIRGIVGTTGVTVTDSTVSGNTGGGIQVTTGTLTVAGSTVSGNTKPGGGSGILAVGVATTTTVTNSTITGNSAGLATGGGIAASGGSLTLTNSTVANNTAGSAGGGILAIGGATTTLTNVTVRGNTVTGAGGVGGGIAVAGGSLALTNGTISGNSASGGGSTGGGLFSAGGAAVTIRNTIVAGNSASAGADCGGVGITSAGHNIDGGTTCAFGQPGDQINTDPDLGPLQDNGGPTATQALLAGSPAIDAGDNTGCPGTDQRGVPRPLDTQTAGVAVCDIGAFEVDTLGFIQMALSLNRTAVRPGDLLVVNLALVNTGGPRPVDVYFVVLFPPAAGPALGCPAGDAIAFLANGFTQVVLSCLSSPLATFAPLLQNVTVPGGLPPTQIPAFFTLVWPPGVPTGPYTLGMALTPAGAFSDGRVDPLAGIVVVTAGFSAIP